MACAKASGVRHWAPSLQAWRGSLCTSTSRPSAPAAMAAIIIGGTSFSGGVGSVFGSLFGCLLLASINNGLVLMHVSSYWQNLVFGTILIIALVLDKVRNDRSGGGLK